MSVPQDGGLKVTDQLLDTPEATPPAAIQTRGVAARTRGARGVGADGEGGSADVGAPADGDGVAGAERLALAASLSWADIEKFPDFKEWSAMKQANKKKGRAATTPPESSEDELRGGKKRRKMSAPRRTVSSRATVASLPSSSDEEEAQVGTSPPVVGPSVGLVVEGVLPVGVRRSQRKRVTRRDVQG